jgi:nitrate/nitrite transport system ATP-binding protein
MTPYLKIDRVFQKLCTADRRTTEVLSDIRLTSTRASSSAIIGHSGCGKSTLLNLVAGLTEVTTGGIIWTGARSTPPARTAPWCSRTIRLLPWLTVYDNVKLAVTRSLAAAKVARRTA